MNSHMEKTAKDHNPGIKDFIAAEEELQALKEQYGIEENTPFWKRAVDALFAHIKQREPVKIKKKKYCLAAFLGGWMGMHQFLVGKKKTGMAYLLLCWSGFPFIMTVFDLWYALFLKTDEEGCILI